MNDFLMKNGKPAIGDGLENEVRDILTARKGDFKFFPDIGVGIAGFVDGKIADQELFSIVAAELKKDNKRLVQARTAGDIYVTRVERN